MAAVGYFRATTLLFTALVIAPHIWSTTYASSINLTLYYEGLCIDCSEFFLHQLWPTYGKLEEHLHVDLVPFGKTHISVVNGSVSFKCQHGPGECYVNEVQTCAVKYVHPTRKLLDFVACMFRQADPTKAGQPCAQKVGTYWPVLDKCSSGPEGEELLLEMGKATLALKPPMEFVPYVQVNGVHNDTMESLVEKDLFHFACKLLQPNPPRVCNKELSNYKCI